MNKRDSHYGKSTKHHDAQPPAAFHSDEHADAVTEAAELLPARMLNEFVYCPRLFYYEHVEGVFAENRATVEGSHLHRRVDEREDDLPPAAELLDGETPRKARSVMLSSERLGVVAKMDLVEADGGCVTPVDYKRGRPRKDERGELAAWDSDRVQLAVQGLILREHGYECREGIVFYAKTRQRVRIAIDARLTEWTEEMIAAARRVAADRSIPPPLRDSPKCPGCSLVGICLPDETRHLAEQPAARGGPVQRLLFPLDPYRGAELCPDVEHEPEVRRLVAARDELRSLYLNTPGLRVGKSDQVLRIQEGRKTVREVRLHEISQVNLFGAIQISTQAIHALCRGEIPIAYFSQGGWFYGITQGLGIKNILMRRDQFRLADVSGFCLRVSRCLVAGKIRNQRTMLQRNHIEPPRGALAQMKCMQRDAEVASDAEQLLGIEGNAARVYFEHFQGMLKVGSHAAGAEAQDPEAGVDGPTLDFGFRHRNRRPPQDPVNALLSLGYSLLAKDLTIIAQAVGLEPYLGFYHQPRPGRASLALDLMEPFRPLVVDSAVLTAINTRMVTVRDFVRAGKAVALTAAGRRKFFQAYEQRMDTLVTHPLFGYRVSYRRLLEIQTRLLARVVTGELATYPVFTTR